MAFNPDVILGVDRKRLSALTWVAFKPYTQRLSSASSEQAQHPLTELWGAYNPVAKLELWQPGVRRRVLLAWHLLAKRQAQSARAGRLGHNGMRKQGPNERHCTKARSEKLLVSQY